CAVACAFAMNTSSLLAQTWEPLSFTYGPADPMESGTRKVFASDKDNTVITAYGMNAGATESHISMDGGANWNLLFSGKPVENALFLPNGNILLATAKKYLTTQIYVADSLFRSADGTNWTNLGEYSSAASDKADYAVAANNKVFIPREDGLN